MKCERQDQLSLVNSGVNSGVTSSSTAATPAPARDLVRRVLEILDGAPLTAAERALVARFERDDADRARRRAEARRARLAAAAAMTAPMVGADAQKKSA